MAAKSAPQPAARAAQPPARKAIFADSNVKEVLAALDSRADPTGETRLMPAPVGRGDPADDTSLTDTQVLRFLETRRGEAGGAQAEAPLQADTAAESGISLLKPDDTGTRRALKEAVSHNEPVSFAVQLQWSVQPVALEKVPPLAIFSAYTLYSVEGSREGRKWYGLRLGFFNDAISAKQVAYYVRSEFTSVAVVPVSPQERERRTPQTLEETLEILGANELAIDSGRGNSVSDTGVRHLRVEVQKNTPFSRLLERLSERVKKA
jgi:hypothetical protein